jgi:hypothetical protein
MGGEARELNPGHMRVHSARHTDDLDAWVVHRAMDNDMRGADPNRVCASPIAVKPSAT